MVRPTGDRRAGRGQRRGKRWSRVSVIDGDREDVWVIGAVLVGGPAVVPTQQLAIEFIALVGLEILLSVLFVHTHRHPSEMWWDTVSRWQTLSAFIIFPQQILKRLSLLEEVLEGKAGRERAARALEKELADDEVFIPIEVRAQIFLLETKSDLCMQRFPTELSAIVTMNAVREAEGGEGRGGRSRERQRQRERERGRLRER
jgi:hypothetical protein